MTHRKIGSRSTSLGGALLALGTGGGESLARGRLESTRGRLASSAIAAATAGWDAPEASGLATKMGEAGAGMDEPCGREGTMPPDAVSTAGEVSPTSRTERAASLQATTHTKAAPTVTTPTVTPLLRRCRTLLPTPPSESVRGAGDDSAFE